MARSIRRTATLGGVGLAGAAGLLAFALAGPNIAFADPSPTPSASAAAAPDARRAQEQDELATALAKELGIDKAKVAAALTKVQAERKAAAKADQIARMKTRLDAAVAAGKLTRAEADAILKAAESGVLSDVAGRPGGPKRR